MKIYKRDDDGKFLSENENLFGKCEEVLNVMKKKRIFNISYNTDDKRFTIYESCDGHFGISLTPELCRGLSELFSKIGDRIEKIQ